jgi:ribonucleoside-diphosphate reductase alpha chain
MDMSLVNSSALPVVSRKKGLTPLGDLIFLDRYARKDQDRSHLQPGQRLVVCVDTQTRQRELATVEATTSDGVLVRLETDGRIITVPLDQTDQPIETIEQALDRMAKAVAQAEKPELREKWTREFRDLLDGFGFVPAGRIWAGAGVEERLTPYNCFRAGTPVQTREGVFNIENLVGRTVAVLSQDGIYRPAEFACYGKQELLAIELANGDVLYATPEHEWLGSKKGARLKVVKTTELEGMSIPFNPATECRVDGPEWLDGVRHGLVFGDGTKTSTFKGRVDLFGACIPLASLFEGAFEIKKRSDTHVAVTGVPAVWKQLPDSSESGTYWRGFFAGLIAADGYVDENGSVYLTQADEGVLRELGRNAPRAGFVTTLPRVIRDKSNFGDQYGPCYTIHLNRIFVSEKDILREDHKENFRAAGAPERGRTVQVQKVRATGLVEDVYCCVESETHTMTVGNGYLTKQCYVLPTPRDSRGGIIQTLDRMTEIMSRGGGVGIPLMSLRPRYGLVRGVNGRSSGSVAWGEIYSFGTGLIEQGGSRRGALMLIQYVWHPDILEFITAKKDNSRIKNANVSVGITDAFMRAVQEDASWDLVFPDTTYPAYNDEWDGDLELWKQKGYPIKTYKTVQARELWDLIVESAWASAEPGLFFVDRYNQMSNSNYYSEGRIWCTNPCGEQGIPGWAVCNLGHINLPQYLVGEGMFEPAKVDWDRLKKAVRTAVRFMDDVVDIAFSPFPENDKQQKGERRVGLGTMGLGELLTRCHIRYGRNQKCLAFLDQLYSTICREAYLASADIATEKGSFPFFDAEKLLASSGFARNLPDDVKQVIRVKGLRGVTNLTQAPTGTVGTMVGTSTGIEGFYTWEWERKGRLGSHRERASVYAEYLQAHPDIAAKRVELPPEEQFSSSKYLPEWFVTSMDMTPEDHAHTQAAIQRWVDSSISKTSNLPTDYTPAQVGDYYRLLFELGCKGGTVYRDKSREEQVLSVPDAPPPEVREVRSVPTDVYDLIGVSVQTPAGKLSAKLGLHPDDGEAFEAWLDVSRAGTAMNADREALARMVSLVLRMDSPLPPLRRLQLVIDQLDGIGGGDSAGFGPHRVLSVPDGIAKAFKMLLVRLQARREAAIEVQEAPAVQAPPKGSNGHSAKPGSNGSNGHGNGHRPLQLDLCPQCHQVGLYRVEGCAKCQICDFSRC